MGVSATQRQSRFKNKVIMMMMMMVVVVMMMVRWELFTVTFQLAVLQPKNEKMKKSRRTNNGK